MEQEVNSRMSLEATDMPGDNGACGKGLEMRPGQGERHLPG